MTRSPAPLRARAARVALVLPLLAAACVTVNIYFPAPEVREAAERIVDETWGTQPAAPEAGPRSSLARRAVLAVARAAAPREAQAAEPDVNVSTAAIRALKDSMKQRSAELRPYLAAGSVGVGKDGLLVVRDAASLDLASRAKAKRLVDAENADRESLYREIASANDYGPERVADIRAIFAGTWRDKAEPSWWVQGDDGAWKRR